VFPKERSIQPRYDQKQFDTKLAKNKFQILVSSDQEGGSLWINQDAVFALGDFQSGSTYTYTIKHPGNGAYVFVIEGSINLDNTNLGRRDAAGVYDTEELSFTVQEDAKVLVIEVPME
jgi:redox-sensitive bicupin YhaK (pirin superfamily)